MYRYTCIAQWCISLVTSLQCILSFYSVLFLLQRKTGHSYSETNTETNIFQTPSLQGTNVCVEEGMKIRKCDRSRLINVRWEREREGGWGIFTSSHFSIPGLNEQIQLLFNQAVNSNQQTVHDVHTSAIYCTIYTTNCTLFIKHSMCNYMLQ